MQMRAQECPVCQCATVTQIWTDSHFNPEQMDKFSFASRKEPEFMHFPLGALCCVQSVVYQSRPCR